MKGFCNFIGGFFLGGVLISAIVMLFTPMSGSEMRGRINDNFHSIRDEVSAAAKSRGDELREELARLQKKSLPS